MRSDVLDGEQLIPNSDVEVTTLASSEGDARKELKKLCHKVLDPVVTNSTVTNAEKDATEVRLLRDAGPSGMGNGEAVLMGN
jgi:hypothetical protein